MSFLNIHDQDHTTGWKQKLAEAFAAGSPFVCHKSFHTETYKDVWEVSPGTGFVFRQWVDDQNQGAWIERAGISPAEADAAADEYIATFKDSVVQHIVNVTGGPAWVESLNEEYPTGNPTKLYNAIQFDLAFIRRLAVHCPGVGPAVFTAAIGNPDHPDAPTLLPLAQACEAAGGLMCYHAYHSVYDGESFVLSYNHQYDLHLRWALSFDAYFVSQGVHVHWYLSEGGAILSAPDGYGPLPLDGWKHDLVWKADEDDYVADLALLDSVLAGTVAAQENRFWGVSLFTSNPNPDEWWMFNIIDSMLTKLTEYVKTHPTPDPIIPTPDPDPGPDPTPDPDPEPTPADPIYEELFNVDFVRVWDIPSGEVPNGWWAASQEGVNYSDEPDNELHETANPEMKQANKTNLPESEWDKYLNDEEVGWKLHGDPPFNVWLFPLNLPFMEPGTYRAEWTFYDDHYRGDWQDKQHPGEVDHSRVAIWLNTPLDFDSPYWTFPAYLEEQTLTKTFEVLTGSAPSIGIQTLTRFHTPGEGGNNGWFTKSFRIYKVEDEPDPEPDPEVDYVVVAHLLPQGTPRDLKKQVIDDDEFHEGEQGFVVSADDAARLVAPGLPGSKVVVWDEFEWEDDIKEWLHSRGVEIVEYKLFTHTGPPEIEIVNFIDELQVHEELEYDTRDLAGITTLTIHHTVTPTDFPVEAIAGYHVQTLGWPGIGYHFVITYDGTIYQTNYLKTVSYHSYGDNDFSVGIALMGDFTNVPPSAEQILATAELVEHLGVGLPVWPLDVAGHKNMPNSQTACPGETWDDWKGEIE